MQFNAGDLYGGSGPSTEAYAQATNATGNGGMTRGLSPEATAPTGDDQLTKAAAVGRKANPIVTFFVLIILVVLIMWGAEKLGGEEGKYTNMRASAYNIFFVSFVAGVGLFFWRNFFTKFPVPGVTTIFHGA